jgi:polyhydroxyalkanoate synthase
MTIKLTAEQIRDELDLYAKKLQVGVQNLQVLGEIDVGTSARELVHQRDEVSLYRYTPITASTEGIPVLIVYALVNRPYMTDLQPDRSLIRWLLEAGLDVYLIDWGYPGNAEQDLDLDAYINGYIDEMVEVLRVTADLRQVNLLGICQGGVFALCYAAMHPQKISNLVTTVTPVDFHTEHDMLSRWVAGVDVDKMVDAFGNDLVLCSTGFLLT